VRDPGGPRESAFVFFSDLDGTLLDHDTYSFAPARSALDLLALRRVPLVLCSSKTRAEMEEVRATLLNRDPFIPENGGAVFIPEGYFPFPVEGTEVRDGFVVRRIGAPYDSVVAALGRASLASGVAVRGFARMSTEEIALATGLPREDAERARRREFDEPFEILDPLRSRALFAAIEREGMRWTSGGRFHHILGASDKGMAVSLLAGLYRDALGPVTTVGFGDSPNDAGFLNVVDIPILIASPRLVRLQELVPRGRATRASGPLGWNEAALALLGKSA
jgi:mannosyl-3-phosphoglycerate phosphatase